jgi:hypothetical protein
MSEGPDHRSVIAAEYKVPRPFRAFAVRSEEALHAADARVPYGRVHVVRTAFVDAPSLARLASVGRQRVDVSAFSDVQHARTTLQELALLAPAPAGACCLAEGLAGALQSTGVLGQDAHAYRASLDTRIDFLVSCGAGFHNDVGRHWSRCLFWLWVLDATEVEFVMPHAGVRLAMSAGDLMVFDPALAHGLCRPGDGGQALPTSFEAGPLRHQVFLTGELLLSDAQWSVLDAPWLPVEVHEGRGALDLMVAEFDERSGAIQRLHALRDCMKRSTCHFDPHDAAG